MSATIHALFDRAAQHRRLSDTGNCSACGEAFPCLVVQLASELYALRKERGQAS